MGVLAFALARKIFPHICSFPCNWWRLDFKFRNQHTTNPPPLNGSKVYLTLVQTDGIGLGAWTRPGRGKVRPCCACQSAAVGSLASFVMCVATSPVSLPA